MELFDEIIQNKLLEDKIAMRRDNQVRKDIVTYGITTINNVKESSQKTNSTISVNKKKQGYLSIYKYSLYLLENKLITTHINQQKIYKGSLYRIIFTNRRNYFHEKKYFSSRQEIFTFMKRNSIQQINAPDTITLPKRKKVLSTFRKQPYRYC